ncbi:hypothetical protein BLA17378_08240 [Burkholderia aenigmatica]|uniref:Uncharacterized protein n=1 Tax=Burkholderia aenigmatica TaxID=2015348 RepID=A0ABY6Y6C2_9BURK|nr:hypothetical protein BLA17378_08240 [Burkholderia aenigmatica]VWD58564.1 hypothetical protein BLA18628_06920 [Burkholderia aenigmatica]
MRPDVRTKMSTRVPQALWRIRAPGVRMDSLYRCGESKFI